MKTIKIICVLLAVLLFGKTNAQNGVTVSPSAYTALDEVTITVDLGKLENKNNRSENLSAIVPYIWLFSNAGDAKTNNSWDNQTDAAKLTKISGNIWQFKFQPDTLFAKAPGELKTYGFLIKNKTGTIQTDDFNPPYKFDPLVFTETVVRMFPTRASQRDLVYIYFRNDLSENVNEQRMQPETITIKAIGTDDKETGTALVNVPLKTNAAGVKYVALHPQTAFGLAAGVQVKELELSFTGKTLGTDGALKPVTSATYKQQLYNAK